jgi:hypothetical protein
LIYASPIWSICNQQLQNDLFKKQKLAIRAIAGLKYNDHTEPFFKKLEILPIPSLIDFFSIQFMQRFVQHFLPAAFADTWTTNAIRREGQSHICLGNDNNLLTLFFLGSNVMYSVLIKLPINSLPNI